MIIVNSLNSLYLRLPVIGKDLREFIVRIFPILTLTFGVILTLISTVDMLATPFVSLFTKSLESSALLKLMFTNLLGIISGAFMILGFSGLRKKTLKGWKFIFWSQIIWILASAINFSPSFILGFIFMYPLFQIKEYYR